MTDVAGALHLLMQRLELTERQWQTEKARAERAEAALRRIATVAERPADVRSLVTAVLGVGP